jgi:aspartate racemase
LDKEYYAIVSFFIFFPFSSMKIIGLIGGMSRESSLEYYRIINETTTAKLGNLHSAKCLLYSVDFEEIETLQHQGKREELTQIMVDAGKRLQQ